MTCPAYPPGAGFISSLLNYVDCQALAIGAGGYQALAAPGSISSVVLTGLLTIFVALFGYRMLFGHRPTVRDGVLALVKIGIVLTLTMSWGAYQILVYDVAFRSPAQVAGEIGRPAAIPGANGGLVWRIDNADRLLVALAQPDLVTAEAASAEPNGFGGAAPRTSAAPVASGYDSWTLGGARILFLTAVGGGLAAMRLIAGVLLALGPLFIGFLLFDRTRGLFEGWLRVLAGTALGALGAAIVIGVELAFIEPRLAHLLTLREAGYVLPGVEVEIFVVAAIFALVLLAMLAATARVAGGLRLFANWRDAAGEWVETWRAQDQQAVLARAGVVPAADDRSRAATVADAVAHTQSREASLTSEAAGTVAPLRTAAPHDRGRTAEHASSPRPVPLGLSHRRTRNRASGSASRRDRTA